MKHCDECLGRSDCAWCMNSTESDANANPDGGNCVDQNDNICEAEYLTTTSCPEISDENEEENSDDTLDD